MKKLLTYIIVGIMLSLLNNSLSAQNKQEKTIVKSSSNSLTLEWTRFIGGSGRDDVGWLRTPILRNDSILYFTGVTMSSDFPVTSGALDSTYNGGSQQWGMEDIFLTKFNVQSGKIIYSTFLGGAKGPEHATDANVDNAENVYIVGNTGSPDYPVTNNALIPKFQGPDFRHADGFFSVLSNGGHKLKYSTFIGGPKNDGVSQILIEPSGDIVLFGESRSNDFRPSSIEYLPANVLQPKEEIKDSGAYVMKLDAKKLNISSARILGDVGKINVQQLSSGDYLIVGNTANAKILTTKGAYDQSFNGGENTWGGDIYIMRLSEDFKTVKFATLFGGNGDDYNPKVTVLPGGDFVIAGWTDSKNLPVTADAIAKKTDSKIASFIARFSEDGKQLKYCTYLGNIVNTNDNNIVKDIVFDGHSKVFVAGYSAALLGFSVTPDAIQLKHNGGNDIFILAFDITDNSLAYCSYFGGSANDNEPRLLFDQHGSMYILGITDSNDFPTGKLNQSIRKDRDIFISKFSIKPHP